MRKSIMKNGSSSNLSGILRSSSNNNNNFNRRVDDGWSETDRSDDEDLELNSQLDELLMTLDDEPTDFDPKEHWVSCRGRFCYELNPCQNWFLVEDPPFTGRTLDVPASFAPTGPCPIFGKLTQLTSALAVLVWSLVVEENKAFFFAYLSTWNLFFCLVYMTCSLVNTTQGVPQPFSRVSGTVRICWFFFVVSAHCGVLEAILYWGTEFDPDDASYDFRTLMLHGGLTLEVILDGFTVNFIPLRWMQWYGCCLPVTVLYVGWTLVHAFFLWVGNPDEDDRNSIYDVIDWRFEWKRSLFVVLLGVFVISPLIFAALWMMSLYKWFCCCCWRRERRKYLQQTGNMEMYREQVAQQVAAAAGKEVETDDSENPSTQEGAAATEDAYLNDATETKGSKRKNRKKMHAI